MDTCEAARLLATATITTEPALIVGVLFATDGTNAPTLSIYDDVDAADATKKVVPPVTGLIASTQWVGFFPNMPIKCRTGIHAVIGGTIGAGEVMIYWRPQ